MKNIHWLSLLFVGIGLLVFFVIRASNPNMVSSANENVSQIQKSDWVTGNKKAKAILVEYGDFQCPACAYYEPIVEKLTNDLGDKFLFIYRNFPLRQIHKNADNSARAVEAAGRQNKYWQMHKIIYLRQKDWAENDSARDIFIKYAKELKLNANQFIQDMDSLDIAQKIEQDLQSGQAANIEGTPTFFLNGKKIQPKDYKDFKNLILSAI